MEETASHQPEKKGSKLNLLFKITFFVAAFLLVIFTVLANMGGNGDFHKNAIEQFASEATGYYARVKLLHNLTYFPTIGADFEDMDFLDDPIEDIGRIHIDRTQVALSFWDVAARNGKMKALNVQGLHALPGTIFEKPVNLKYFAILDTGENQAKLEGSGTIDTQPLVFSMNMTSEGAGRSKKYSFDNPRNISFVLSDVKLTATLQNASNPYLSIQNIVLSLNDKPVITGQIDISKRRAHEVLIGGSIKMEQSGSILKPDLLLDLTTHKISGAITSDNLNHADFAAGSEFNALVNRMAGYLSSPEKSRNMLDNFFAAQDVTLNGNKLQFENNILKSK